MMRFVASGENVPTILAKFSNFSSHTLNEPTWLTIFLEVIKP